MRNSAMGEIETNMNRGIYKTELAKQRYHDGFIMKRTIMNNLMNNPDVKLSEKLKVNLHTDQVFSNSGAVIRPVKRCDEFVKREYRAI